MEVSKSNQTPTMTEHTNDILTNQTINTLLQKCAGQIFDLWEFPSFFVEKRYTYVYLISAMNTLQSLLNQLASFTEMERGTLSVIRQSASGPCCNFQRWDKGRHRSEYIPADQVPRVEANLANYRQFETLVEQYVDLVSKESREARLARVKKKRQTIASRLPKKPKSKP
jgi:hypothetical protein